jgi:hypothetical protein
MGPASADPITLARKLVAETLEALVELLDTTGRVHDALLARVEGVRLARDFHVDDGVLVTVFPFHHLATAHRRTREKRRARRQVVKNDRSVLGVNVSLHCDPRFDVKKSSVFEPTRQFSR